MKTIQIKMMMINKMANMFNHFTAHMAYQAHLNNMPRKYRFV